MAARRPRHGSRIVGSRIVASIALLVALAAAGCGSSGSTTAASAGPDPASVAPADAVLYGQAVVRPSGAMKDGVLAAARKVLDVQDPGAQLRRLLDASGRTGGTSFAHDIEPWLGERVGGFLLLPSGGSAKPDWGVALAIADRRSFDDALARIRRNGDQREAGSYRGVTYDKDRADGAYSAPVGDFYVGGSLGGVRAAIDAAKGSSLGGSSRFKDAVGGVPHDALAFLYADPKAIAAAAGNVRDAPAAARQALARYADADPVTASITASADRVALEASADQKLTAALDGGGSNATVSVGQLPGDAWLALATPPLGPLLRQVLDATGLHAAASERVHSGVGLDLDRDLLGPLGGLGMFVRGSSPLDVGGGALLQMTDAAAAQRLLTRIEAIVAAGTHAPTRSVDLAGARGFELQIPQSPQPIVVLAKGDRVAAGYAASSAQDLLDPQQRFDGSSGGRAAIATLGDGYTPSFVLLVPQLATLLGALDQLQVVNLSSVLPYLNAYRSLAVGTKHDGNRTTVRVVAALR
ncbi:MAG TPA: DUF3352 domain-containing protein [Conexibacter sp.]|jgi:hypothetical protein|nr:DUF3352 domain-containing protein [Conexibacter sp.]